MSSLLNSIGRALLSHLGSRQRAASPSPEYMATAPAPVSQDQPPHALSIPCPDPTTETRLRDAQHLRAQRLVRQESWQVLAHLIRHADDAKTMTPAAMPIADLIAYGARADVVASAEHALFEQDHGPATQLLPGVEALEFVLSEYPQDPYIAGIVAQTHMDVGWLWQKTGASQEAETTLQGRTAFSAHFERAAEIMLPFAAQMKRSPYLASVGCALLAGQSVSARALADKYEHLIDLNPANPSPMRALGTYLLPRWRGSHGTLEVEARRTAARTEKTWGAGGYTWVMSGAVADDAEACGGLDTDFFFDGLRDILSHRNDPHTVNLLAAFCAISMAEPTGDEAADAVRAQICAQAGWIVRDHLTELHPLIWAHAARGFDNASPIRSPQRFAAHGRSEAMQALSALFASELDAGQQITFTDQGPIAEG